MDTLMEFPILDVVNKKMKDPMTSPVEKKTPDKALTKKSPGNTGGITCESNQPERKITKRRGTRRGNKDKQLEEETTVRSERSGENEVIKERVPLAKPKRGRPSKSPTVMKKGLPLENQKRGRPPKSHAVIKPREEPLDVLLFGAVQDVPQLSVVFSPPQVVFSQTVAKKSEQPKRNFGELQMIFRDPNMDNNNDVHEASTPIQTLQQMKQMNQVLHTSDHTNITEEGPSPIYLDCLSSLTPLERNICQHIAQEATDYHVYWPPYYPMYLKIGESHVVYPNSRVTGHIRITTE
ncbi:uncharacterized protein [Spinacia oleracea]|uniref:Uncharacterized protein n=1 Tax=Spinacia oleracea TaxID=3562 RepID=A0A9R0HX51_SPIOL|nr:uncharacterized protein LOC110778377 [Spinacia oleracea]